MPAEYRLSVRDGDRVREVVLAGTVTVGRAATCEISSPDPRLSRIHASFEVVGGQVVVRDLASGNGTRVNGALITEHRLTTGDQVEVGPFIVQVIVGAAAPRRPAPGPFADDATIMMVKRHPGEGAASADTPPAPVATPPAPAASVVNESDDKTRMLRRSDVSASVAQAIAEARHTPPRDTSPRDTPPRETSPITERRPRPGARSPHVAAPSPQAVERAPAVAPAAARAAVTELTFANAALLWIVPIVLISFLAGLLPDFMQPDERAPLLRAHYLALAASAVELVTLSREPAAPVDNVTTALRRQAGVIGARVVGADGRVLAPMDQAGTTVPPPALAGSPAITESGLSVEVSVPARTGDGRPVLVILTVDPERIHPATPGSVLPTLLLILSLGAAWLVARHLTTITDTRLSRLGEEIELMTTRQISAGRDPFGLNGGRRIVDAVTFALSAVGRVASGASLAAPPATAASGDRSATASIDADAAFRIVTADRGCESLLGINPAVGAHLIDVLPDQAVSNEVLRLVTVATPDRVASGEVTGESGVRLGIEVTKGAGDALLSIRFRRL